MPETSLMDLHERRAMAQPVDKSSPTSVIGDLKARCGAAVSMETRLTVLAAEIIKADMQFLVFEIDHLAAEMAKCFEELSPGAKAAALNLAHSLASIRVEARKNLDVEICKK